MVLSWALLLFVLFFFSPKRGYSYPLLSKAALLLWQIWLLPAIHYKQSKDLCADIRGVIRSNRKKKLMQNCFYYKDIKIQCIFKVEISCKSEKSCDANAPCTAPLWWLLILDRNIDLFSSQTNTDKILENKNKQKKRNKNYHTWSLTICRLKQTT